MNKNRFFQVLRWELLLSKKQLATMALTFLGLVVIPQMVTLLFKSDSSSAYTMGLFCTILLYTYFVLCGALVFSSLRTRQQRINNFMLPASNKEKFLARYFVLVIAMPVAALVGFLAGDVLQYLISLMINSNGAQWATHAICDSADNSSVVFNVYHNFDSEMTPVEGFFTVLLGTFAQHACTLLFGSVYHKHPLVLSVLTWMGIGLALLTIGALTAYWLTSFFNGGYIIVLYDFWWKLFAYVFNIAFIVFCYWFAYRRYTRLQVINNRWINR